MFELAKEQLDIKKAAREFAQDELPMSIGCYLVTYSNLTIISNRDIL
jgi:hypothetical protein